ncbi:TMEM175 family protein [Sulfurovum sp. NBC37-1]|uniref:TMEM175 family protein n=1 Tax=Sulfurovum sp. (strain NBC37-1) TaxID=387093 RepID=UPI00015875B0|nr:TMEM175 family protein [Sulfurovum sp. NBC37-1]BAF71829.1 conserved hypothetical protein [Sulfurovum sp. NBC37-1]
MKKNRLEAFSDGVLAIVITILILDLKTPREPTLDALLSLWPVYVAYVISFITVFMSWLNHHHIFNNFSTVNYKILWVNGFFLFAVSQIPFATAFVGETRWGSELPIMLYGITMMVVVLASIWLRLSVSIPKHRSDPYIHIHIKMSLLVAAAYLIAALLAWIHPKISLLIFVLITLLRLFSSPAYRKLY